MSHIETERKYIISMPSVRVLCSLPEYTHSAIEQIYLESPIGITHRIRRREYEDRVEYTETKKIRVSAISAIEDEREITEDEYNALRRKIKVGTRPIIKSRHTLVVESQLYEIDIYPEWKNSAILEIELSDEGNTVKFPEFIKIIKEVSGLREYSNAAMSRTFPEETVNN